MPGKALVVERNVLYTAVIMQALKDAGCDVVDRFDSADEAKAAIAGGMYNAFAVTCGLDVGNPGLRLIHELREEGRKNVIVLLKLETTDNFVVLKGGFCSGHSGFVEMARRFFPPCQ